MFWKKKEEAKHKIILGMVLLNDTQPLVVNNFLKDFKENYKNQIDNPNCDNSSLVFEVDSELVCVGQMLIPIPAADIEGTTKYAYNWVNALQDLKNHKGHLIVSIVRGSSDQIKRYKIFTQVICSLLRTTNSIGVYMGSQTLLIPHDDYLNEAQLMTDNYLPLNLWIYFGLKTEKEKSFGYTYGLKEFNKKEMEILNSNKSLEDIRGFLFNMSHYVLDYNVEFKDGQTCGLTQDEKIKISLTKGKLVEGNTFKLEY